MSYIELINNFWRKDEFWQFDGTDTRLYFLLLKIANTVGWDNSSEKTPNSAAVFEYTDSRLAGLVGVSINTFKTSQKKLIKSGLISVQLGGRSYGNKSRYQILIPNSVPNSIPNSLPNSIPNSVAYNKTKTKNIPLNPPSGGRGKKKNDSLNSEARKTFEVHFKKTFSEDYYWTAKDAGSMTKLINALKFRREKKGLPNETSDVINALKIFLESITDEWVLKNYSVSVIFSKFNEIIAKAKEKNGEQKRSNTVTFNSVTT